MGCGLVEMQIIKSLLIEGIRYEGLKHIVVMRLAGNHPWAYALSTGWLSFGSLVTFTGLLVNMQKARR